MCGITGAIWDDPRLALDAKTLAAMSAAIRHRGPDDEGSYFYPGGSALLDTSSTRHGGPAVAPGGRPGVALGHRRLSIIDLATGHQPLSNEDGSVVVVFNGEIYNFVELRRELIAAGHQFRTACDTEVLVHLYERDGLEFVQQLVGMFALAIWDERAARLVLARDRLGKKPLYYRHEPGRLMFASELKSLLAVPGVPGEVDPVALDEYLTYQYVPHPRTMLRGFHKLPPGHRAVYAAGTFSIDAYWRPDYNHEIELSDQEYRRLLREQLSTAVALRLVSDVPLGAFLSGGVDSSLVVALMQQAAGERVRTFSIGFGEPEYDETPHARLVAAHLGTRHTELRVEPSAVDILPRLVRHYDDPLADPSAIPTWYVARLAREHVTVALTGDGGDELFAGYLRYRAMPLGALADRLPLLRDLAAARIWQRLPGTRRTSLLQRIKRLAAPLDLPPARRYLEWIAVFGAARRRALYSTDFCRRLDGHDAAGFLLSAWAAASDRDPVTQASLCDLQTYLPCDLLAKVDVASMAHGLECRAPMLDHRVVELAIGMPRRLKYRRGRGKRILRETFGDLVPESVFRRPKMGFGVPLDHWFRGPLRELTRDVLLGARARERGYFDPAMVERLVVEHESARFDHSPRLWALLFIEMWQREWIDSDAPPVGVRRSTSAG